MIIITKTKNITDTDTVLIMYRHSSKCFICINFFTLHNSGKERLKTLPRVTSLVNGGHGILTQAVWLQIFPLGYWEFGGVREFPFLGVSDEISSNVDDACRFHSGPFHTEGCLGRHHNVSTMALWPSRSLKGQAGPDEATSPEATTNMSSYLIH